MFGHLITFKSQKAWCMVCLIFHMGLINVRRCKMVQTDMIIKEVKSCESNLPWLWWQHQRWLWGREQILDLWMWPLLQRPALHTHRDAARTRKRWFYLEKKHNILLEWKMAVFIRKLPVNMKSMLWIILLWKAWVGLRKANPLLLSKRASPSVLTMEKVLEI